MLAELASAADRVEPGVRNPNAGNDLGPTDRVDLVGPKAIIKLTNDIVTSSRELETPDFRRDLEERLGAGSVDPVQPAPELGDRETARARAPAHTAASSDADADLDLEDETDTDQTDGEAIDSPPLDELTEAVRQAAIANVFARRRPPSPPGITDATDPPVDGGITPEDATAWRSDPPPARMAWQDRPDGLLHPVQEDGGDILTATSPAPRRPGDASAAIADPQSAWPSDTREVDPATARPPPQSEEEAGLWPAERLGSDDEDPPTPRLRAVLAPRLRAHDNEPDDRPDDGRAMPDFPVRDQSHGDADSPDTSRSDRAPRWGVNAFPGETQNDDGGPVRRTQMPWEEQHHVGSEPGEAVQRATAADDTVAGTRPAPRINKRLLLISLAIGVAAAIAVVALIPWPLIGAGMPTAAPPEPQRTASLAPGPGTLPAAKAGPMQQRSDPRAVPLSSAAPVDGSEPVRARPDPPRPEPAAAEVPHRAEAASLKAEHERLQKLAKAATARADRSEAELAAALKDAAGMQRKADDAKNELVKQKAVTESLKADLATARERISELERRLRAVVADGLASRDTARPTAASAPARGERTNLTSAVTAQDRGSSPAITEAEKRDARNRTQPCLAAYLHAGETPRELASRIGLHELVLFVLNTNILTMNPYNPATGLGDRNGRYGIAQAVPGGIWLYVPPTIPELESFGVRPLSQGELDGIAKVHFACSPQEISKRLAAAERDGLIPQAYLDDLRKARL